MNNKIKVTENLFNGVKAMAKGGATIPEIAQFAGLSPATISRIKAANTYEEYLTPKEQTKPQEVAESRQTVIVQASHYMLTEQQKTNELLTGISQKLAFIVEELCGVKKSNAEQDH